MGLFAISDLHLSFYNYKPMDIFSPIWENHHLKLKENWNNIIKENDTVLIPGDISWGLKLEHAKLDLDYISSLNGRKIITYGNHDYWWKSTNKLNELYEDINFIKKGIFNYKNYNICCIRGWLCPGDTYFQDKDEKIYLKEVRTLRNLLKECTNLNNLETILLMHFPPTNDKLDNSLFLELIKEYNIKKVIFGHIHGNFECCLKGNIENTFYYLVSCDFLKFKPIKII